MKNLRHPNIVKLIGVCWDDTMLACLLEYVSNGSLEDHLRKDWAQPKDEKLTWKDKLLRIATEVAHGVQYLHNSRYFDEKEEVWKDCIIHRDLKPDNIMIEAESGRVMVMDFGIALVQAQDDINTTDYVLGTAAPQQESQGQG